MIGFLRGQLIEKNTENILIDVSGVGYEIEVPASTLCLLPPLEHEIRLFILTHVREDAIRLFGFISAFDKRVFQELISVSGVGPKAALALLGPVDGFDLCKMITAAQLVRLTSIPGIGPKTAERLVLELKSKLQKRLSRQSDDLELQKTRVATSIAGSIVSDKRVSQKIEQRLLRKQMIEDLRGALANLGYKDKQYERVISGVEQRMELGEELPLEMALKESLQKLSEHILQKN